VPPSQIFPITLVPDPESKREESKKGIMKERRRESCLGV